jgi:alkylation response protein AidB-like acyl-CoA dehydrogenase
MTAAGDVLARARQIADELLFPAAMAVDSADRIPEGQLEALAAAGFYGLAGPAIAGGLDLDLPAFCDVIEIMAGGCLATAFVWLQHHGAVRALMASANTELARKWLEPLCRGSRRAGVALAGRLPGPAPLRAEAVPGGYVFDGTAPWVTGWGMIDVLHTLARDADGNVIAALLPVGPAGGSITAERLELAAVNASATVSLRFSAHFVPAAQVSGVQPHAELLAADAGGLRVNGSLALGVAARCWQLALSADRSTGDGLERELAGVRDALNAADASSLPTARAAASAFAYRAAGLLTTAAGSQSILVSAHPQRLAREALFLLVFGSRPAIKADLLGLLARPEPSG